MTGAPILISVAKDFSRTPGPRRAAEGPFSGEVFLKDVLKGRFEAAIKGTQKLIVDLDGAAGYATSFLEAAFGGLAREYEPELVLRTIEIKSDDEPDLVDEIREYIREARL